MPRPVKPARLELRQQPGCRAVWYIMHKGKWISTGRGADEIAGAEEALADYSGQIRDVGQRRRDPTQTLIADVIALYAEDVAPHHARPHETADRLGRLLRFFGDDVLADITGRRCRAYAAEIGSASSARRALQDLRAAINHYRREVYGLEQITIWMPDKEEARPRWLNRSEAARVIWTAWRKRKSFRGRPTKHAIWKHIAKYGLVAIYTGSRAGIICAASFYQEDGRGFVDVDNGVFYRKAPRSRRTKKRAPVVRIPDRLLPHLRRWKRMGQRYVVEWNSKPVQTVKRHFPNVVEEAGLGPDVTAHTFRHTAATWAMRNRRGDGTDPSLHDQAEYLGMSVHTLLTVYGHHAPDHLKSAGDMIAKRPQNVATKQQGNPRTEREREDKPIRKAQ